MVACIMPTYDRESFVPRAVRYFQQQTYENKQLIVVDDGPRAIRDLLPNDDRIHYVRLESRTALGTKRNLACEQTSADIIVHWDDDDWMAPTWTEMQVRALMQSEADVVGLSRLYFYEPARRQAWCYVYPESARPWVAGATLCYRHEFWRRSPFREIDAGEDLRFVWDSSDMKLVPHNHMDLFVACIHDGNTVRKSLNGARWQPCAVDRVESILLQFDAYISAPASAPSR